MIPAAIIVLEMEVSKNTVSACFALPKPRDNTKDPCFTSSDAAKMLASVPNQPAVVACIFAGLFAFFPYLACASPLPVSIDTLYVNVTASPGDHLARSFKFWNGTDAFLPLHLQVADFAAQGEEGQIVVDGEEDAANSLRTWVKPAIPDLFVAPKQEITLDFTIDVPTNADPGSHWGTLLSVTSPQDTGPGWACRGGLASLFMSGFWGR